MPDEEQKRGEQKPEAGEASAQAPEDKFRPEAIAARVDALGEETELERVARDEEKKLQERRKAKKGKRGLETAASKRLAKIGEGKVKRPSALGDDLAPEADPLLERAAHLSKWIKDHQQTFGALVAVGALGAIGLAGHAYWQNKREGEASALLAQAIADEHGQVSDKDEDDSDSSSLYPTFKSAADRRQAALSSYRQVESKYPGTGAAILARLSEAGLLLDQGDANGAEAACRDVKVSPLAQADAEVRGRALEGIGFADELLAQKDAANEGKHLQDALAAFKLLEQVDLRGFKELGKYDEARVLQAQGDKAKAIKLLEDVHAAITDPGEMHPFSYLQTVVDDRLRALDPTAIPPKSRGGMPGGGQPDMNDPRVQEMIRQLQQQMRQKGGAPPAPAPAPPPK